MKSSRRALGIGLGVTCALAAIGVSGTVSCASSPDEYRITYVLTPDFETYRTQVDAYLTRRCGSLDCHGQPGRAYRIYSREGFRLYNILDGSLVSGQQPTQLEEQRANFQALVALEPEEMTRLMARQGENPDVLLFLRKPLKLERHKGGPAMAIDDDGYRCVVAWLSIPVVDGQGNLIPAQNRVKLSQVSPNAPQRCANAASFP